MSLRKDFYNGYPDWKLFEVDITQGDISAMDYNGFPGIEVFEAEPVAGWVDNYLGVANANIAKVRGVLKANILKVV